jgi:hypothetical protein
MTEFLFNTFGLWFWILSEVQEKQYCMYDWDVLRLEARCWV